MKRANFSALFSDCEYKESLDLYVRLLSSSFVPDHFTFPFLLKSCSKLQSLPLAQQIHGHVVKFGFGTNLYAASALTGAYAKLGSFRDTFKVFEKIPHPTLPSYNAIVSGLSQRGRFQELWQAFRQLMTVGLRPNSVTLASVLPACDHVELGSQLHGYSIKMGHDMDDYVATALVTMYSNCAALAMAQRVFELIPEKNEVSYNAMISGFAISASSHMAVDLFRIMISSSEPNSTTFITVLSACSEISDLQLAQQIHCFILKRETSCCDAKIGTALVDAYWKCDSVEQAYQVFTGMQNKNILTWNSMISGLLSKGYVGRAADMLRQLKSEGFSPDAVTCNTMISGYAKHGYIAEAFRLFTLMQSEGTGYPSLECLTSLLQACSSISDLLHGKEIHGHVIRTRADHVDEVLQTTLIHMYMKCGCPVHARTAFNQVESELSDPAIWNAMISGYARNGEVSEALCVLRRMQERMINPNPATFLTCLSACNHAGQVEEGLEIFKEMTTKYGMSPTAEHFNCIANLLGRAGKLAEAWCLLNKMPEPSVALYSSLLSASRCYGDAELGQKIAERLCHLEQGNPTPMVILSNIYASKGLWKEAEWLRKTITRQKLVKEPGCSWIGAKRYQFSDALILMPDRDNQIH